ncbi:MAG TPA: AMP-binding protein [Candidatus Cybelea sp.]|nr:AMP-binding protein [Candidatus Cybelea sp.]
MNIQLNKAPAPAQVAGCDTLPAVFWKRVHEWGPKIALREKDFGIWRSITWTEYGQRAKWAGHGLLALGLKTGDVVSIISENNPEWLYTDLGTLGVGGVTNGVYTTDSAKQVEYIVNDSRTRFFFAENEEQLDKILEVRERCPTVAKIIVYDMEGLRDFRDPQVMSFDDFIKLGQEHEKQHPGLWEELVKSAKPNNLAILIYTSGTTGPPKGAMISHSNILFQIVTGEELIPAHEGDQQLSFLPLCHIAERTFTTFVPLRTGAVVNFAESVETVPENIREVQPTTFFAVPRIWEKFYSGIAIRMKEATWAGRVAYRLAMGIGMKIADARIKGETPSLLLRLAFKVADVLVLANIKRMLGLERAQFLGTGAAPIAPDLIKWYLALGLDMREVYGQTENTGLATFMPGNRTKLGTVGIAEPHTEVKISPEGEILLKGPHVFLGYYNNPQKTAETVVDGWLHTGDVGFIDNEGFVKITDRMKDIIITAGGKNITPSEIENQLKFSPYISDAIVIGDRRKFLTSLVMIDYDSVVKFAQDHNVPFTNFASLCRAKEVQTLISDEIEKVNKNFARVETVKRFRLIEQELTAEDDELTPTMKLKRKLVNQKYKDLIDSMYQEA